MAILYDRFGNEINYLDHVNGSLITDDRPNTSVLAALNAETFFDCASHSSAAVDVRGTFVGTLNVEATIDGTNYFSTPVFVPTSEIWQVNITAAGSYICHLPAACKRVRVRCSAFTSGSMVVALRGSVSDNIVYAKPLPTTLSGTLLTTANTAGTLTLAAPGAGLFHYITGVKIDRINNSAAAITGSALLAYTTTNLPGSLAFSAGNALAAGAQVNDVDLKFAGNPLKSSVANTATTFVAPAAGAGVQIRLIVFYYSAA